MPQRFESGKKINALSNISLLLYSTITGAHIYHRALHVRELPENDRDSSDNVRSLPDDERSIPNNNATYAVHWQDLVLNYPPHLLFILGSLCGFLFFVIILSLVVGCHYSRSRRRENAFEKKIPILMIAPGTKRYSENKRTHSPDTDSSDTEVIATLTTDDGTTTITLSTDTDERSNKLKRNAKGKTSTSSLSKPKSNMSSRQSQRKDYERKYPETHARNFKEANMENRSSKTLVPVHDRASHSQSKRSDVRDQINKARKSNVNRSKSNITAHVDWKNITGSSVQSQIEHKNNITRNKAGEEVSIGNVSRIRSGLMQAQIRHSLEDSRNLLNEREKKSEMAPEMHVRSSRLSSFGHHGLENAGLPQSRMKPSTATASVPNEERNKERYNLRNPKMHEYKTHEELENRTGDTRFHEKTFQSFSDKDYVAVPEGSKMLETESDTHIQTGRRKSVPGFSYLNPDHTGIQNVIIRDRSEQTSDPLHIGTVLDSLHKELKKSPRILQDNPKERQSHNLNNPSNDTRNIPQSQPHTQRAAKNIVQNQNRKTMFKDSNHLPVPEFESSHYSWNAIPYQHSASFKTPNRELRNISQQYHRNTNQSETGTQFQAKSSDSLLDLTPSRQISTMKMFPGDRTCIEQNPQSYYTKTQHPSCQDISHHPSGYRVPAFEQRPEVQSSRHQNESNINHTSRSVLENLQQNLNMEREPRTFRLRNRYNSKCNSVQSLPCPLTRRPGPITSLRSKSFPEAFLQVSNDHVLASQHQYESDLDSNMSTSETNQNKQTDFVNKSHTPPESQRFSSKHIPNQSSSFHKRAAPTTPHCITCCKVASDDKDYSLKRASHSSIKTAKSCPSTLYHQASGSCNEVYEKGLNEQLLPHDHEMTSKEAKGLHSKENILSGKAGSIETPSLKHISQVDQSYKPARYHSIAEYTSRHQASRLQNSSSARDLQISTTPQNTQTPKSCPENTGKATVHSSLRPQSLEQPFQFVTGQKLSASEQHSDKSLNSPEVQMAPSGRTYDTSEHVQTVRFSSLKPQSIEQAFEFVTGKKLSATEQHSSKSLNSPEGQAAPLGHTYDTSEHVQAVCFSSLKPRSIEQAYEFVTGKKLSATEQHSNKPLNSPEGHASPPGPTYDTSERVQAVPSGEQFSYRADRPYKSDLVVHTFCLNQMDSANNALHKSNTTGRLTRQPDAPLQKASSYPEAFERVTGHRLSLSDRFSNAPIVHLKEERSPYQRASSYPEAFERVTGHRLSLSDRFSNTSVVHLKEERSPQPYPDGTDFKTSSSKTNRIVHSSSKTNMLVHSSSKANMIVHSSSTPNRIVHSSSKANRIVHSSSTPSMIVHSSSKPKRIVHLINGQEANG